MPIDCTCPSPFGCAVHGPQPREHAVACACGRETWRVDAVCEKCASERAAS